MKKMRCVVSGFLASLILLTSCGQAAPTWQEQYDLGVRYLSEGNYEEAIIAFTAAIEIDPNHALAYVGRGDAYIGLGETEENLTAALTDYQEAIELDTGLESAYLGAADVYIKQGDYESARALLETALEAIEGSEALAELLGSLPEDGPEAEPEPEESGPEQQLNDSSGGSSSSLHIKAIGYKNGEAYAWKDYICSPEGYIKSYAYQSENRAEYYEYDSSGNTTVRDSGSGPSKNTITYDGTQIVSSQNEGGWWSEYQYDGEQLIAIYSYLSSDKPLGLEKFSYDNEKKLIGLTTYNYVTGEEADDFITHQYTFSYDEGKVSKITPKGDNAYYYVLSYNEDGLLEKAESFKPNGTLSYTWVYEYQDITFGDLKKVVSYTPAYFQMIFAGFVILFH